MVFNFNCKNPKLFLLNFKSLDNEHIDTKLVYSCIDYLKIDERLEKAEDEMLKNKKDVYGESEIIEKFFKDNIKDVVEIGINVSPKTEIGSHSLYLR